MSLFIPTSHKSNAPFPITVMKGQLYNLDTNESLNFQFNPSSLEWERATRWGETKWKGDHTGGDIDYIYTDPHTLNIPLLYISEPGAPRVDYNATERIMDNGIVDFQQIKQLIDRWEKPLYRIGRPSRILVIFGPNSFECVIINSNFKITEFFEDLTPREALLNLDFRVWTTI